MTTSPTPKVSVSCLVFGGGFIVLGAAAALNGSIDIDAGAVAAIAFLTAGVTGLAAVVANARARKPDTNFDADDELESDWNDALVDDPLDP